MRLIHFRRTSLAILAALVMAVAPIFGAAGSVTTPAGLLSNTTLNGAITISATTLVLSSASASSGSTYGAPAAGQCLYLGLELMRITAVSSTTMTVQRGTFGASSHASGEIVLTGPCNGNSGGFMKAPPNNLGGNQDCSNYVLPWIDVNTGNDYWCDLSAVAVSNSGMAGTGTWSVTNPNARNGTAGSRRVAQ